MSNNVNLAAIDDFEKKEIAPRKIGAEIVASREAQEVQVAMVAAKRFPRDEIDAYNRVINDCTRRTLAEKALYEYPRGGQVVTGPSIHLARAIARSWGNLDSGFKVLDQTEKASTVMAYCWDLETNFRETKVFTVRHVRETKKGAYPLTDSRDIYELIANQAARRERACILSVIPGDVVDAAVGQCNVTLAGKSNKPLVDTVRDMIRAFKDNYGVTDEMLEKFIGCKKEAFSQQSVVRLRNVYNTLKDGSAGVEQYFDMTTVAPKQDDAQDGTEDDAPVRADKKQVKLSDV